MNTPKINWPWPLIILDRDGVINHDSDAFIKSAAEWRPLPGSLAAIAELNRAGAHVAVASNQSGIARGLFDATDLNHMQDKCDRLLQQHEGHIDSWHYCPHGPDSGCDCRKPAAGMLRRIMANFACTPAQTIMLGDSLRDLQAARAASCACVLLRTGKGQRTLSTLPAAYAEVPIYDDLASWVTDTARSC